MNFGLQTNAETLAEKAEELQFCKGVKLSYIRENVAKLLACIGRNKLFEEYTLHDISHIDAMLKITDWLIPDVTKKVMTPAEWLMLTLAIYFHDLGMVVTKREFDNRNKTNFPQYKQEFLERLDNSEKRKYLDDDHFLYQEFVREHHAQRVRTWIEGKGTTELGDAAEVILEIQEMLSHLDKLFKKDLALICESHHLDDLEDFKKYRVNACYGSSPEEKVNLNYIAIILRITDLLHITRDRTPSISMKMFNVTNPVSIIEWKKQQAVRAVVAQTRRNEEGNIDNGLEKNTIEITALFDGPDTAEAYFGLSIYLKYVQSELLRCKAIISKAKRTEGTVDYNFPWEKIDETQIIATGFETKKFQFVLDQDNILQLLVGHTIYNDSSVVIRELVQNAVDAIRLQKEYEIKNNCKPQTEGKVSVIWNSHKRELTITDNGTGMTINDIENYFLKVGVSKYQDREIKQQFPNFSPISHFGIGILSCFMVADNIDLTTNSEDEEDAIIINLRNLNGTYLLRKVQKNFVDEAIKSHGTKIVLHVRNTADLSEIEKHMQKWILSPEIPVYLKKDNNDEIRIGFDSPKEALINFLASIGISTTGKDYNINEISCGNVTIAYIIKYSKFFADWELVGPSEFDIDEDEMDEIIPVGTCIEGIRVEFTTPGFKNTPVLAIANIKGGQYRTNVARSEVEIDEHRSILSDIYTVYRKYLQSQIESIKKNNFSQSWALSECQYLLSHLLRTNSIGFAPEPIDSSLLIQVFSDLEYAIIEDRGERKCISVNQVRSLEEINIFACTMMSAIEQMLTEVPSNTSASSIVKVLWSDNNFLSNTRNVFCNYIPRNILHEYALQNKEISHITVNRDKRIIQFTYSNSDKPLLKKYEVGLSSNKRFLSHSISCYIFVPIRECVITGLNGEIGVEFCNNIYLASNNEVSSYIVKMLDKLESEKVSKYLIDLFLRFSIFSCISTGTTTSTNKNQISALVQHQLNSDDAEDLWKVINRKEFLDVLLKKSYSLYSTTNWNRDQPENIIQGMISL